MIGDTCEFSRIHRFAYDEGTKESADTVEPDNIGLTLYEEFLEFLGVGEIGAREYESEKSLYICESIFWEIPPEYLDGIPTSPKGFCDSRNMRLYTSEEGTVI